MTPSALVCGRMRWHAEGGESSNQETVKQTQHNEKTTGITMNVDRSVVGNVMRDMIHMITNMSTAIVGVKMNAIMTTVMICRVIPAMAIAHLTINMVREIIIMATMLPMTRGMILTSVYIGEMMQGGARGDGIGVVIS